MSLNELLDILRTFVVQIPFTIFDYIILFGLLGYVIEEESYNIGIVIKRTLSLILCAFLALFLYRFPSIALQDLFYITKGIADGIALLGVWVICMVVGGMISHLIIKEKMSSFSVPQKLKIPLTFLVAVGGFLGLIWIIIHVFVSLPLPSQAKSFLTSSVTVKRILVATFQSDLVLQRIYTQDPSAALHVLIINEKDEKKDLKSQTKKVQTYPENGDISNAINAYRSIIKRDDLITEELLSSFAFDLASKYSQGGIIENQASELATLFGERGALFSKAHTVTIVLDSNNLLVPALISNIPSKVILRNPAISRMGYSLLRLNGNSIMAVFIFTD